MSLTQKKLWALAALNELVELHFDLKVSKLKFKNTENHVQMKGTNACFTGELILYYITFSFESNLISKQIVVS